MTVEWVYLPNYDDDPKVAIKQIAEDYAEYTYTSVLGEKWTISATFSEQITLQGQPALRQTITQKSDRGLFSHNCNAAGYRLIILPKSWSTNVQRAVWLDATYCEGQSRHAADMKRVADSLRLIEPF